MHRRQVLVGVSAALAGRLAAPAIAQASTEVSFLFPVAVGGPIASTIERVAADFNASTPSIRVTPTFAGNYQETLAKVLAGHRSGTPPTLSVLLSTDMFTMIDQEAALPFDRFVESPEDQAWLRGFYPAFMANSQTVWRTWGIPFQRSTLLLYWNKAAFDEVGLVPERAPVTWAEHIGMAERLTARDGAGNVTRWGTQIPSGDFAYWSLQALAIQSGVALANMEGTRTAFDNPAVVEALTYLVDLSRRYRVMAPGVIDWDLTPQDFLDRKTAIMWTTTGNLTNVRVNARFPFGVAALPRNRLFGTPTGGGNFYLSRKAKPQEQEAAVRFVRWATQPERAARWSIDTGYVAVSPAAYATPVMSDYLSRFPAAGVARDQLSFARPELSTYENRSITAALETNVRAALNGLKTPLRALQDAQSDAGRILRNY